MNETAHGLPTELRARGRAVLPAPRQVDLQGGKLRLTAGWRVAATNVSSQDIAVRTLTDTLRGEHPSRASGSNDGVGLAPAAGEAGTIHLAVQSGSVETGTGDERDHQAYRLSVRPDRVEVVGNGAAGLFYGVQTLLQLLDGNGRDRLTLPLGTITDWPEYQLRFVHWDTKHHQDRMETLKRFLDWMARFKLNAVSFELEDKFAYPSHPVIGAPGAFTVEQMQELVRYGLARHIQIVPNVQAPAHLCYVLKHEEFAHLRCDGSNYQICMDDPEARKLLFEMYDDACCATEGVEYFHVSTDEVYYAGICEKYRKPYNPENRSLTWVDYVRAAHEHLSRKARRVIVWAEFPLLAEHVRLLPAAIIDGVGGPSKPDDLARATHEHGMRQLVYASMQGAERLFPNHFAFVDRDGRRRPGRLADAHQVALRRGMRFGRPIGTFAAAWDDSGLHNETFWLGWAMMAQGGWTPGAASVEETAAAFMDLYYGRGVTDMVEVYRDMQAQARFWERAWDRSPSRVRGPAYGSSHGKRPVQRRDMTLAAPALPKLPDLAVEPVYARRYAKLLAEAPQRLRENDRLLGRLHANLVRARRNRYSLEVFVSLVDFVRAFLEMLLGIAAAEDRLVQAAAAEKEENRSQAVELLLGAHAGVGEILRRVGNSYGNLVRVWAKSRYPRNAPAGGREFVHVMDDVKDHFADRRADLSYHIAPFESIGLDRWRDALAELIASYARTHGIDVELA